MTLSPNDTALHLVASLFEAAARGERRVELQMPLPASGASLALTVELSPATPQEPRPR